MMPQDSASLHSRSARLILASGSDARRLLLSEIGSRFLVSASSAKEPHLPYETPDGCALRLAFRKAFSVPAPLPVLAADTVAATAGRILRSPVNAAAAEEILRLISGHWVSVHTGVVLRTGMRARSICQHGLMLFDEISPERAQAYLQSAEWRGKAGGFSIQGQASALISAVQGSYTAIVGLPLPETAALLEDAGISL